MASEPDPTMHAPSRFSSRPRAASVRLAVLLCGMAPLATLAATSPLSPARTDYIASFLYAPTAAPERLQTSVVVDAAASFDPAMLDFWRKTVGHEYMVGDTLTGLGAAIVNDLSKSGLFTTVSEPGAGAGDYRLVVRAEVLEPANIKLRMRLTLLNPAGAELFTRTAEALIGVSASSSGSRRVTYTVTRTPTFPGDLGPNHFSFVYLVDGCVRSSLQELMGVLKEGVTDALQRIQQQPLTAKLREARLVELMVGSDPYADVARERNRAIIAAKNSQLPSLLRNGRDEELSTLVTKIEQLMLDLDHDSEMLRERAQQAAAGGAGRGDELRSLSLSYRERIELLKPIVAQLGAELARREQQQAGGQRGGAAPTGN
jgi:hypothetical protein